MNNALKAVLATAAIATSAHAQENEGDNVEVNPEAEVGVSDFDIHNTNSSAHVGIDGSNNSNYAMQYQHRTEGGQPVYTLKYDHLLYERITECRDISFNGVGCENYPVETDDVIEKPVNARTQTNAAVATLSTNRGVLVQRIEAQDVTSGFAKAANLLHADAFIEKMELSFLHNGELVERAVCEADTYNPTKAPLEYDPAARTADTITCSWSGPGLD